MTGDLARAQVAAYDNDENDTDNDDNDNEK